MKYRRTLFAALVATTLVTVACGFEHSSEILLPTRVPSVASVAATTPATPTAPAAPAAPVAPVAPAAPVAPLSYVGTWTSQSLVVPSASSCSNFQWRITSQTSNSLTGEFSATCAGGIAIVASATGQLNGTTVPLTVTGTATLAGLPACNFSLTGTGLIEDDTLRIPYTGTTCLGPIHGTEVLRRPEPPAPPPPPPAALTPSAPSGGPSHVGPGPLSEERASQVIFATSKEFPGLTAAKGSEGEGVEAAGELLQRMIWHLQLAGYEAARQRNPSGAISNDKLTILIGSWRSFDVFGSLGTPGVPIQVQFVEVAPPNPVASSGIPD